jgi:hypothetical protein
MRSSISQRTGCSAYKSNFAVAPEAAHGPLAVIGVASVEESGVVAAALTSLVVAEDTDTNRRPTTCIDDRIFAPEFRVESHIVINIIERIESD